MSANTFQIPLHGAQDNVVPPPPSVSLSWFTIIVLFAMVMTLYFIGKHLFYYAQYRFYAWRNSSSTYRSHNEDYTSEEEEEEYSSEEEVEKPVRRKTPRRSKRRRGKQY